MGPIFGFINKRIGQNNYFQTRGGGGVKILIKSVFTDFFKYSKNTKKRLKLGHTSKIIFYNAIIYNDMMDNSTYSNRR